MKNLRRRLLSGACATIATSALMLGTVAASPASAILLPKPNTEALVSSSTVLVDGEDNPCAIAQKLGQQDGKTLVWVEDGCGAAVRPLMGAYKYVKNGGLSYEQVAAKEAGKPLPSYTTEQILISYGMLQPLYIQGHREEGIVGYLVFIVPKAGAVAKIYAQYR